MALLFLAPALVVGGKCLLRNYKILVLVIMIPYFIFTSGVVFEATKCTNIDSVYIPYSHALSASRVDSTGLYTSADVEVRDWIVDNGISAYTRSDLWAGILINEKVGNYAHTGAVYPYFLYNSKGRGDIDDTPDEFYIFLRERNTIREELTINILGRVGTRNIESYDAVNFDEVLAGRSIVYQVGNAMVYGPR